MRLPLSVRKYQENNNLRVFCYVRAVQKSTEAKPKNEFKHLWVTKTFIFTSESFPTTRRRVEVVERKEVTLRPVQNAASTVIAKTRELAEKLDYVENYPGNVDLNPLSMLLNGMIDAAVNGGTQKYIEAFCTAEFLKEYKDETSVRHQNELKQALRDQIGMLKRGMNFVIPRSDSLKGLFEHLSANYDKMVSQTTSLLS
jgi:dedicator of cytokinesis protein 3